MSEVSWQDECRRAAALFDGGQAAEAAEIFRAICARPDLGQTDKAMMFINLATVCEKMGQHDEALRAFDDARAQALQAYLYVQQSRGVFLTRIGRLAEAAAIFEELLREPALTGDYRKGSEENLAFTRRQLSGESTSAGSMPGSSSTRFTETQRQSL